MQIWNVDQHGLVLVAKWVYRWTWSEWIHER